MSSRFRDNLTARATWKRGLFMVLFALLYNLAELLILAVAVFQFVHKLITGEVNERLLVLGGGLSAYVYQVLRFLTFVAEEMPYPFAPWPSGGAEAGE
jgi:hypothetical protein